MRRFCELILAAGSSLTLTLGLGLGSPAVAVAATTSPYQQVLHVYEREGTVPPCQFTSLQLETALKGVDTYGAQYFADFTQAVQAALTSRAAGECSGSAPAGAAPASGGTADSGRAIRLGPVTAATSSGIPAPLIVLAVLAVALALLGGFTGLARARARARG